MTLEELFAGNSWRVEEPPGRPAERRFAVMATAPTSFGVEVEICAVQWRPHAEAIAALPELAAVAAEVSRFDPTCLVESDHVLTQLGLADLLRAALNAVAKAEGRS